MLDFFIYRISLYVCLSVCMFGCNRLDIFPYRHVPVAPQLTTSLVPTHPAPNTATPQTQRNFQPWIPSDTHQTAEDTPQLPLRFQSGSPNGIPPIPLSFQAEIQNVTPPTLPNCTPEIIPRRVHTPKGYLQKTL